MDTSAADTGVIASAADAGATASAERRWGDEDDDAADAVAGDSGSEPYGGAGVVDTVSASEAQMYNDWNERVAYYTSFATYNPQQLASYTVSLESRLEAAEQANRWLSQSVTMIPSFVHKPAYEGDEAGTPEFESRLDSTMRGKYESPTYYMMRFHPPESRGRADHEDIPKYTILKREPQTGGHRGTENRGTERPGGHRGTERPGNRGMSRGRGRGRERGRGSSVGSVGRGRGRRGRRSLATDGCTVKYSKNVKNPVNLE